MKNFAAQFSNVRVYDLLPEFQRYAKEHNINYEKFFHSCDGHWSPLGNYVAGKYLAAVI